LTLSYFPGYLFHFREHPKSPRKVKALEVEKNEKSGGGEKKKIKKKSLKNLARLELSLFPFDAANSFPLSLERGSPAAFRRVPCV